VWRERFRLPRGVDPFELLFAYVCVVVGIPFALGLSAPTSIERLLPELLIRGWGIALTFGGALVITGIGIRQRRAATVRRIVAGLRVESAGLVPMAGASAVFFFAILAIGGWRVAFPAGTYLAFTAACGYRLWQIRDAERGFHRATQ
jgi:hypothetical protein